MAFYFPRHAIPRFSHTFFAFLQKCNELNLHFWAELRRKPAMNDYKAELGKISMMIEPRAS